MKKLAVGLAVATFAWLAGATGTAPAAGPPKAGVIFTADFETGDLAGLHPSGNSPAVTDTPARAGKHAMKTYLHREQSRCRYRTEVVPREQNTRVGEEYWYGFSILLPEDYKPDPVWEIVAQWHGRPDFELGENWRNPIMAIWTANGKWVVGNRWDPKPNTFEGGKRRYGGSKRWDLGPQEPGKWVDWVFHVKWSFEDDGLLEVWKDGKKVIERKGPNTFNDKKGPYLKLGIYKGWKDERGRAKSVVESRTLYHDEIRIGRAPCQYEGVAPGGKSPVRP
ncbi:MAG: polysaccharide lyase [Kiritimatiellae bacterium]|nr:polysaccharide lyase [Kiritimatiellia bacterium]